MHIMNIPCRITLFMWNVIRCFMYIIAYAFQVGGNPYRKISLLGVAHPVVDKYISGTRGVLEAETSPRTQL